MELKKRNATFLFLAVTAGSKNRSINPLACLCQFQSDLEGHLGSTEATPLEVDT